MTNYIKSIFTCILLSVITLNIQAQKERNYIYLFDCTRSMTGYNGSTVVMPQTQDFLQKSTASLSDGTEIHIILFQDEVIEVYSCNKEEFDWNGIKQKIDKSTQSITNTNICDAWKTGESLIDKNKDNYIILLTDGGDNVNGIPALTSLIGDFCSKFDNNSRGFYVKLTEDAIDLSKPGAQGLLDQIERCPQTYLVDATGGIKAFFSVNMANASTNTLILDKPLSATCSAMEQIKMKAETSDPFFNIEIENGESKDGKMKIKITPKKKENVADLNQRLANSMNGSESEYEFKFNIKLQDGNFELCNPEQTIKISNKPERVVEFLSMTDIESNIGTAEYYPSFLFWSEKRLDTLKFDLTPIFNAEAKKDNSYLILEVNDRNGRNDYTLLLNGLPLPDNKIKLDNNSGKTILGIEFKRDAQEGKRYFDFKFNNSKSQNLERINTDEIQNASFCLRAEYEITWNPLKWILLILGIVILTALVVWFLILRRNFYPCIRIGRLIVDGNNGYYIDKKIKGYRQVILTNKNTKQGWFNKVFTGEIKYIVDEEWTCPIEMTPKRKGIKIKTDSSIYDIDSTMEVDIEYKVKNNDTNQNYVFQFSK